MTFVQELDAKFTQLKSTAEGDIHQLVLRLESVFNRVHLAVVSDVLKQAVSTDIHAALDHVTAVADGVRANVDTVDKVVDTADDLLDSTVTK